MTGKSRGIFTGLAAIVWVGATAVLGALCGGVWIKHAMLHAPDGWTGIANALGALMVGGVVGLVVALVMLIPLAARSAQAIMTATGIVALGSVLVFLYLWVTRPVGSASDAPTRTPPPPIFQPRFEVSVAHPYVDRLLRGMDPDGGPLPFARVTVTSFPPDGPTFEIEELGADRRRCASTLDFATLDRVLALSRPAIDEDLGVCRRPGSRVQVSFGWRFPDNNEPVSGGSSLDDACLEETPKLRALIAALDDLGERLGDELACETIPASE